MSFGVRFTEEALDNLARLYEDLLQHANDDWRPAEAGLDAIRHGIALLETSPLGCRRAAGGDVLLRELLVGFGAAGYVLLFEVEDAETVTVLAARHQRDEDFR